MDDFNVSSYESHSGTTTIISLRMIEEGKTITLNVISIDDFADATYDYSPREEFQKHPAMDILEKRHQRVLEL